MIRLLTSLLLVTQLAIAQQPTPKAVFIIVDGIPADVIEKLELPTLREISNSGGFTRAHQGGEKGKITQTPTISAPGYANILTGVWGYKHNVWDNNIAAPNYNYPNIFRIARNVSPTLKLGVFSTWEDNRTKLIGTTTPMDFQFDGLEKDTIRYPHDKESIYISKIDEAVATEAARVIRDNAPDLSWVYLEFTDDMGHRYGDSPQFYDAVRMADDHIKKIWDAIKTREVQNHEAWCIIVTTDHGRSADTGKNHGGQSDRERTTWIATNAKALNSHFKDNPAAVDILPTLCRHLGLEIPNEISRELDGMPLTGPIDISNLEATKEGNRVKLNWKNRSGNNSTLDITTSSTDHFKTGGHDEFKSIGRVPAAAEKFEFKTSDKFLKIAVKGQDQTSAVWTTVK